MFGTVHPLLGGSAATAAERADAVSEMNELSISCDIGEISEMRAGLALEGSALEAAWKLRGLPEELDLDQFRELWLEVMPARTSWRETLQMFNEIDVNNDQCIEIHEIIEYLELEREQRRGKRLPPPETWRQKLWACVGSDPLEETMRALRPKVRAARTPGSPGGAARWCAAARLSNLVCCTRAWRYALTIIFVVVTIVGTLKTTRQDDGGWGANSAVVGLEVFCVAYLSVEAVLYVISFPHGLRNLLCGTHLWLYLFSVLPFYLEMTTPLGYVEVSSVSIGRLGHNPIVRALRAVGLVSQQPHSMMPRLAELFRECWVPLLWLLVLVIMFSTVAASLLFAFERSEATFCNGEWLIKEEQGPTAPTGSPTSPPPTQSPTPNDSNINSIECDLLKQGVPLERLHFQDMAEYMWWTLAAVCTGDQGYDEWAPRTVPGKLVGASCMLLSLVIISYPVTIVLDTVQQQHRRKKEEEERRGLRGDLHRALRRYLGAAGRPGTFTGLKSQSPGSRLTAVASQRRPSVSPGSPRGPQRWAEDLKNSFAALRDEVVALRQHSPLGGRSGESSPARTPRRGSPVRGAAAPARDSPWASPSGLAAQPGDLASAVAALVAAHGFSELCAEVVRHGAAAGPCAHSQPRAAAAAAALRGARQLAAPPPQLEPPNAGTLSRSLTQQRSSAPADSQAASAGSAASAEQDRLRRISSEGAPSRPAGTCPPTLSGALLPADPCRALSADSPRQSLAAALPARQGSAALRPPARRAAQTAVHSGRPAQTSLRVTDHGEGRRGSLPQL
eukprot:TRINITY_DN14178_c0_g1_i3.p1 TRINITY_DN14178_c0_g1~~TRINITY_DN14178_c0_g1_i3.p1  ORF type:complete len:825 (+),score=177.14 TRINITY_DN14178_c0_g1_i3:110-2476(+)